MKGQTLVALTAVCACAFGTLVQGEPEPDVLAFRIELLKEYKTIAASQSVMEIQRKLGAPLHKSREILYRRTLEQWFFDTPRPFYVEVAFPTGKKARVLAVHTSENLRAP
jgi:hypothetical protein